MREAKFRAWDGMRMTLSGVYFDNSRGTVETAAEMPLMQYTGLKDKNGVEIYEGDIVEWQDEDGEKIAVGPVGWRNQYSVWAVGIALTEIEPEDLWIEGLYTVIGNIHENPELLND